MPKWMTAGALLATCALLLAAAAPASASPRTVSAPRASARTLVDDRGLRIAGAVPLPARIHHRGRNPFSSGAGSVVAGLGDVNGDGLADLAVSGREPSNGFFGTTTVVFVVFGKRDRAPVDLAALGSGGFVIRTVSGAMDIFSGRPVGDVNGDGRADIGVTALEQVGEDAGHVVVVPGRADSAPVVIDEMPAITGTGGMELGQGLAPAGDLNGDGFGDVLLGAPTPNYAGKPGRGAVFVLYGSATPAAGLQWRRPLSGFEVDGPPATREFGYAVARAGRGFVAGAPGRGRGGAWIVPGRGASPLQLAPLVTDGPPAWPSPGPRARGHSWRRASARCCTPAAVVRW